MVTEPMTRLPAHRPQSLDVSPRTGGAPRLGQLLQQHVDQLDVEGLVAGHDKVAKAENGTLSHGKPWALKLGGQRLDQTWVELNQEAAKPDFNSISSP